MAFVTVRIKGKEGYTRVALGKKRMVLGRSSEADLPIKHTSISREHCAFLQTGNDWFIEDLGSSNGTRVNRTRLTGKAQLQEQDIIKIGKCRLTFHRGDVNQPEGANEGAHDSDDDDEDDDGHAGGTPGGHEHEPEDALLCHGCNTWLNYAHRSAGEKLPCPRCAASNTVPS